MTEKERVANELRKKLNWYLARQDINKAAGHCAYIAAALLSIPYITRAFETGNIGDFLVPGMMLVMAKLANMSVEEANASLNAKHKEFSNRLNNLIANKKTR